VKLNSVQVLSRKSWHRDRPVESSARWRLATRARNGDIVA
jgi:hypothetical protein